MELVITDEKSVNRTQIFHWEVSTGKTGVLFQEFRLFRKISCGTNQKVGISGIFWQMENALAASLREQDEPNYALKLARWRYLAHSGLRTDSDQK